MGIERWWDVNDFINARDSFLANTQWHNHRVIFLKFKEYEIQNQDRPLIERTKMPRWYQRAAEVWLSPVRVFDTVKQGYFTTGDLQVQSEFKIQGYSAAYLLPNGTRINEYAGDQLIWNGKIWIVADQVDPRIAGDLGPTIFYNTTLRRIDRSSQGVTPGPT